MLDSSKFPNQSYRFSNSWAFKSFDEWVRVWAQEFGYPEDMTLEEMAVALEVSDSTCVECGSTKGLESGSDSVHRCADCAKEFENFRESSMTFDERVKSGGLYRCELCRKAVTSWDGLVIDAELQTYCAATAFSGHTIGL